MDENRTVRCSTLVEELNLALEVDSNLAAIGRNAKCCGIISQLRLGLTIGSEITDYPIQQGDKAPMRCLHPRTV